MDLYLEGRKCVTAVIVHVDGKALMIHDQTKQCLSTSITPVKKSHMARVLSGEVPEFIKGEFDTERQPVEAAFALAALENAALKFNIQGLEEMESIRMLRANCPFTQAILDNNSKDYKMMAFSLDVNGLASESADELAQRFIMVDRLRVYSKPSSEDPRDMDVYYMGMKMTRMTGIICLLYWDARFS
jgi:hypothetical protein